VFGIACIDMTPPQGPLSISELQLPSPSVILGDTMRDSTGAPAPLRVIAYDVHNLQIPNIVPQFIITDSAPAAHLTATQSLIGDRIGTLHILGQIIPGQAQTAALQTPGVAIPVTFKPFRIVAGTVTTLIAPLTGDTAQKAFMPIPATVLSQLDSASQGIIVRYSIVRAPASKDPKVPAVYLSDDNGNPSSVDTTDPTGIVSRRLVVVPARLLDTALALGHKVDTATILAAANYAGTGLLNSPLTFNVPIQIKLSISAASGSRRPSTEGILGSLRSQRGMRWARAAVVQETPHQAR
jgi:hypothetical protein